jgi:hypothetical protein
MLYWVILISMFCANMFGVILHFTHRSRTGSLMLHLFSAVNESTWEHLKLAFIPMLFISFIQYFILKGEYLNVLEGNLYGILLVLILIPLLYYSVRLFLKREVLFVSILIFILSVILGYVLIYFFISSNISYIGELYSLLSLIFLFLLFSFFTFFPPKMFLFKDPISGRYGHIK